MSNIGDWEVIPMDSKVKEYLKALEEIGTNIEKISGNFGVVNSEIILKETEKTITDVKVMKGKYKILANDFNRQYEKLKSLTPPSILKQSHAKLLDSYVNYVKSTQLSIDSLNENTGDMDFGTFAEGVRGQGRATEKIVAISNEIFDTVVKNLNKK